MTPQKRHPEWSHRPFQASRLAARRATRGIALRTTAGLTYRGLRFRLLTTMPQGHTDVNDSLPIKIFFRGLWGVALAYRISAGPQAPACESILKALRLCYEKCRVRFAHRNGGRGGPPTRPFLYFGSTLKIIYPQLRSKGHNRFPFNLIWPPILWYRVSLILERDASP